MLQESGFTTYFWVSSLRLLVTTLIALEQTGKFLEGGEDVVASTMKDFPIQIPEPFERYLAFVNHFCDLVNNMNSQFHNVLR